MRCNSLPRGLILAGVAMATLAFTAISANAVTIVYEGFQYNDAATGTDPGSWPGGTTFDLLGEPDGLGTPADVDATGLAGTWANPTAGDNDNMFKKSGSLVFGDLPTAGNHIGFRSNLDNDRYNRALTAGAQSSISGAGEIWFSILAEKLQNNFSAAEGGFVLANQLVGNPRILLNDGTDGLAGFGVAPTTSGNNWTPYAWDGSSQSVGDAALTVGVGNGDVHLLVGQISFDTGAGGADQYTLYDYQLNAGSIIGGTLNPIASTIEVSVNQGDLDVVNLTRQVNLNYDELRIGTSLDAVLGIEAEAAPIPEPSAFALAALGLSGLAWFGRRRRR